MSPATHVFFGRARFYACQHAPSNRSVVADASGLPLKRALNPAGIRAPFARYSHGVAVPANAEFVFCSGQLGLKAGDTLPPTVAGQAEVCFENIAAILAGGGHGRWPMSSASTPTSRSAST